MPLFRTPFQGYAVRWSPFDEGRLAVATAQNFGIIGNGKLHVLQVSAARRCECAEVVAPRPRGGGGAGRPAARRAMGAGSQGGRAPGLWSRPTRADTVHSVLFLFLFLHHIDPPTA